MQDIYVQIQERERKQREALQRLYIQPLSTQENRLTTLDVYPDKAAVRKVLVPYPYKTEPKTVMDALARGKQVLKNEANWVKGTEHVIGGGACSVNSKTADDPFCGSWAACARGAVSLVTRGVVKQDMPSVGKVAWNAPDEFSTEFKGDPKFKQAQGLYEAAERFLDIAAVARGRGSSIVSLNDSDLTTRQDVLDTFDTAMRIAELHGKELINTVSKSGVKVY